MIVLMPQFHLQLLKPVALPRGYPRQRYRPAWDPCPPSSAPAGFFTVPAFEDVSCLCLVGQGPGCSPGAQCTATPVDTAGSCLAALSQALAGGFCTSWESPLCPAFLKLVASPVLWKAHHSRAWPGVWRKPARQGTRIRDSAQGLWTLKALTGHQVLPILSSTAHLCTTAKFCSLPLEEKTLCFNSSATQQNTTRAAFCAACARQQSGGADARSALLLPGGPLEETQGHS